MKPIEPIIMPVLVTAGGVLPSGDAEVDDLRAGVGQDDVGRLEVPCA